MANLPNECMRSAFRVTTAAQALLGVCEGGHLREQMPAFSFPREEKSQMRAQALQAGDGQRLADDLHGLEKRR